MTNGSAGPRSRLDKCSLHPPQHMSQSFYLLKASLVLHPSLFSLLVYYILSFVSEQFLDHKPTRSAWWRTSRFRHETLKGEMCCLCAEGVKCLNYATKHVQTSLWLLHSRKFPPLCVSTPLCSPLSCIPQASLLIYMCSYVFSSPQTPRPSSP